MSDGYSADLELARSLADAADELTVARFRSSDLVVDTKPDLTPVSDADRAVEDLVRARLAAERPDDQFFGEETGSSGDAALSVGRRWVVDPIDGTKNYVRGVPVWASLIALLEDGVPVVGVVSAPALGQRWWAASGLGAYARSGTGESRRIAVSGVADLADASFSYASLSGWRVLGRYQEFLTLLDHVWRSRAYGDFYSYMLVAEGAVDAAAEPELSLWDMAALAPIVTEAGGRFSGLDGVDGVFGGNAVATNGLLHKDVLDRLAPR